jgi:hypothetical protein
MATTMISMIGGAKNARKLVDELVKAGFKQQDIELLAGGEQEILDKVLERGFAEDDARAYAKAARGGKTLVAARAPEDKVDTTSSSATRAPGPRAPAGRARPFRRSRRSSRSPSARSRPAACASLPGSASGRSARSSSGRRPGSAHWRWIPTTRW